MNSRDIVKTSNLFKSLCDNELNLHTVIPYKRDKGKKNRRVLKEGIQDSFLYLE